MNQILFNKIFVEYDIQKDPVLDNLSKLINLVINAIDIFVV
jgi:hypothetical protein